MTRRAPATPLAAYVLHRWDWSESSLIVDLFTRERGLSTRSHHFQTLFDGRAKVRYQGRTIQNLDRRDKLMPDCRTQPLERFNRFLEALVNGSFCRRHQQPIGNGGVTRCWPGSRPNGT